MISLDLLRTIGKPIVLIFTSPTCGPCTALMPEIGRWQRDYSNKLTIVLLSRGSVEDNRTKASENHLSRLVIQHQDEVDRLYGVHGTPSAVLVHPDGLIEHSLVTGAESIRALVANAANLHRLSLLPLVLPKNDERAAPEPVVPRVGSLAPAFSLSDLQGKPVSLGSFLGDPTLLLFWNPDCGFCKKMLPDLKAWETTPPQGAPRLLVISKGTVKQNRALGLCSPVLLDGDDRVSTLFGVNGTPMAIQVDAQGRIASNLVAGAPDVLLLAGVAKSAIPFSRA